MIDLHESQAEEKERYPKEYIVPSSLRPFMKDEALGVLIAVRWIEATSIHEKTDIQILQCIGERSKHEAIGGKICLLGKAVRNIFMNTKHMRSRRQDLVDEERLLQHSKSNWICSYLRRQATYIVQLLPKKIDSTITILFNARHHNEEKERKLSEEEFWQVREMVRCVSREKTNRARMNTQSQTQPYYSKQLERMWSVPGS